MIATSPDELPIRLARAAFYRALAEGDLSAIGPLLAPDVVLVTGSDSAVITGKKAQLAAWKREFAAPPATRTAYVRTPASFTLGTTEPLAMELGSWTGSNVATGTALASGSYAAKWRNRAPAGAPPLWVLEAEIFVTLM